MVKDIPVFTLFLNSVSNLIEYQDIVRGVAQPGSAFAWGAEVAGSNPVTPTSNKDLKLTNSFGLLAL